MTEYRKTAVVLALCCVLGSPVFGPGVAVADDNGPEDAARETFDRLYGQLFRQARGSRSPTDAVAAGQELFSAARTEGIDPHLRAMLLEHAYKLGSRHVSGYDMAIEAMQKLARRNPDRRTEALDNAASLARRGFRSADAQTRPSWAERCVDMMVELAAAYEEAGDLRAAQNTIMQASPFVHTAGRRAAEDVTANRQRIDGLVRLERQVETLRSRMDREDDEDGELAAELALVLLADLNRPEDALELAGQIQNEQLSRRVELANKSMSELDSDQRLEMAQWYLELSDDRSSDARFGLLMRADAAFEAFLDSRDSDRDSRTVAELTRRRIASDIRRLAADGVGPAVTRMRTRRIDMFDHVGSHGRADRDVWRVSDGQLQANLHEEAGWSRGPWFRLRAGHSYQLRMRVTVRRVNAHRGGLRFDFPVNDTLLEFRWVLNTREETPQPRYTRGRPRRVKGFRGGPGEFRPGHEYTLVFNVRQVGSNVSIDITIDDEQFIQWRGTTRELTPPNPEHAGYPQQFRIRFTPDSAMSINELTINGEVEPLGEDTPRRF